MDGNIKMVNGLFKRMKQKSIFSIEYRSIVLLIYLLFNHSHKNISNSIMLNVLLFLYRFSLI